MIYEKQVSQITAGSWRWKTRKTQGITYDHETIITINTSNNTSALAKIRLKLSTLVRP